MEDRTWCRNQGALHRGGGQSVESRRPGAHKVQARRKAGKAQVIGSSQVKKAYLGLCVNSLLGVAQG